MLFRRMRAELVNVDVNYDDEVECKNMHLKLLPQDIETMSTKSVGLLAKPGVTGASHKRKNSDPMVVPVTKRLTFRKQTQVHGMSMLSDVQFAELKKRIDKPRKVRSVKCNGRITERLRRNGHSGDRLIKQ